MSIPPEKKNGVYPPPPAQHYSLLPLSLPHVLYMRLPDSSLPPQPFNASSKNGGLLLLDHHSNQTYPPDECLRLTYFPLAQHGQNDDSIVQNIKAATEIYQQSATSFLIRIPNEFHAQDVPSHEQDPAVFDNFRLQFYDGLENRMDESLSGDWAKEYSEPHYYGSIGTWGDLIERLARVFNQYTTFRDPFFGGYYEEQGQGQGQSPGYWPDEKAVSRGAIPRYDPGAYAGGSNGDGRLIFVDEDTGSPLLGMEDQKVEAHNIQHGIKDPVEIIMPTTPGAPVIVQPAPEEYLRDALNPAYSKSSIVNASILASRFIVTTSEYISNAMLTQADKFTRTTQPRSQPMTFSPTAHTRIEQFHNFSSSAAKFTANTVGQVTNLAQNVGAKLGGKNDPRPGSRAVTDGKKPGILNKSLIAFGTVADGVETAAKHLLGSTVTAGTTVVGHRYGDEARQVAHGIGSSVKNVGLVYVDASGVSRRAVVKSLAKGMVVGRVRGGSVTQPQKPGSGEELIVYGGENSSYYGNQQAPPAYGSPSSGPSGVAGPSNLGPITNPSQHIQPGVGLDSFGSAARQASFPSNVAGANPGFGGPGSRSKGGSPKKAKTGFF